MKNISCGWLLVVASLVLAPVFGAFSQPLNVNTLAGYGGPGSADGTGSGARFKTPGGVAMDGAGNVYVADSFNHTIRMITPAGVTTTLAGTAGVSGTNNGTGTSALFNQPQGVALDGSGNLYIADTGSDTIRKITHSGSNWVVSTFAGSAGVSGTNNGSGAGAQFNLPQGVAVDGSGNVYVADTQNHAIRKITGGGAVSTYAGITGTNGSGDGTGGSAQFYLPQGVAVDGGGNVYVADTGNQTIRKIASGAVVSTLAGLAGNFGGADGTGTNAQFYQPAAVAVDGNGFVYVSDYFNSTIRRVTGAGVVTTVAGSAGIYASNDGTGSAARFWGPAGIAASGTSTTTLYVADSVNNTIRKVVTTGGSGTVTTLAGSASDGSADGAGSAARFYWPSGVTMDGGGNVFVTDSANSTIRKVTSAGAVSTLSGVAGSTGSADGPSGTARFFGAQGIASDGNGNFYVADTGNSTIRKVSSSGTASTFAGTAGATGILDGTGPAAQFFGPQGVAVDTGGNVYVADTWNHTIRKITSGAIVSTLAGSPGNFGSADGTNSAARFNWPTGIAVDGGGNLYVSDYYNDTIRKITPAGLVTTLAGLAGVWGSADGTNNGARFFGPTGISVDGNGNVFVVDSGNNTIRELSMSGTNCIVTTVAGMPGITGSADGVGSGAQFFYPASIFVNGSNSFAIADAGNNTIRSGIGLTNLAPMIFSQPAGLSVNPGATVSFTVAAGALTPVSYQWFFNGVTIAGATSYTYTRANVQIGDVGAYSVVVSNQVGNVTSSNALLTLVGAPTIITQPSSQSAMAGQNASFTVVVSGTQPLVFQWKFNNTILAGATSSALNLIGVSSADNGLYSVSVSNNQGGVVSSNALLEVTALGVWGDNSFGQLGVPSGSIDVIAIAAGAWHSLALQSDGAVIAWGNDADGECDVPANVDDALAIAAGGYHSLAIHADGTVAAWGAGDHGQTNIPPGLSNVIAVAAGTWHSLALKRDGTVVAWGDNSWGQSTVPAGLSNVVAIAAGGGHSLALRKDGTMAAWGENTDANGNPVGESIVPLGLTNVSAFAAGEYYTLAVRGDGTVTAWGDDSQGQCDVPAGLSNVVAIAGGGGQTLALRKDGTLIAWGANWSGQATVPALMTNVVGVSAGENHSLALVAGNLPVPILLTPAWQSGKFGVLVQTLNRRNYELDFKNTLSDPSWNPVITNGGNGALRLLVDPVGPTPQRYYRMRQW